MALTNKKVGFSYVASKANFTSALQAELANDIVFVADTREIFTHGTFFGMQAVTLNYDASSNKIQLKDGNTVLTELDATPFTANGINIKGEHTLLPNETVEDYLGTITDASDGDLYFVGDGVNDYEEYVWANGGWQRLGGLSRAEVESEIGTLRRNVQGFVDDITVVEGDNDADFTLMIPDSII